MQYWRRFQVEIRPEAWEALLQSAARDRRSTKEQAGWLLEEALLGDKAPKRPPSDALSEAVA